MKRRKFLTIAGIGGVIAAVTTSFKFASTSFKSAAVRMIRAELNFLVLDDRGIEQFVSDFSKNKTAEYRWAIRGYSFFGVKSQKSGKIHQLISAYLLSTDFFRNGMDESKTVYYVGLYDPYRRPCAHPFSHLNYPAAREGQTAHFLK